MHKSESVLEKNLSPCGFCRSTNHKVKIKGQSPYAGPDHAQGAGHQDYKRCACHTQVNQGTLSMIGYSYKPTDCKTTTQLRNDHITVPKIQGRLGFIHKDD